MSQQFRFGFENDEDVKEDHLSQDDGCLEVTHSGAEQGSPAGAEPCLHSLEDLLTTLPSKFEYNTITIPSPDYGNIHIARRELFDIRAQLMTEDNALDNSSTAGLSTDDIKPNIYEGGFKTWECSIDLANHLATQRDYLLHIQSDPSTIIELGAGTALPTLFLYRILFSKHEAQKPHHTNIVLADYNLSVLKLATIPNLLLNYHLADVSEPGDVEFLYDPSVEFPAFLGKINTEIRALSGSWSPDFAALALPESSEPPRDVLILASETIYSPASTRAFTETLLDLIRRSEKAGGKARALVAAKKVYFGVGGGVDEFLDVLQQLGGEGKVVWSTEGSGSGVERCILEVTNRTGNVDNR
ncbi:MAG: hypothetical protein Q9178_003350 [Gyalolechia marmorata]